MGYPGGKGRSYQRLINLMPPHRVYIETHVGGGAVIRHKRPAQRSIGLDIDARVVDALRVAERHFDILHADAARYLREYVFEGDELVYCDPPYLPSTRRRARCYRRDYTEADHVELLAVLRTIPCAVMVSGYPSSLYDRALSGWRSVELDVSTHTGLRRECVWLNFAPPALLHDYTFVGDNFRHRERVRRKISRWICRLEALPVTERNAVLSAIGARFEVAGSALTSGRQS